MKMLKSRPVTPARPQDVAAPAAPAARAPRARKPARVAAQPAAPEPATVPVATTAPAAALQQAHSFLGLLAQSMVRQAQNAGASAALLPLLARAGTSAELLELQAAMAGRLLQLQQDWCQEGAAWMEEFAQLRRADTLSEHLEQFYNLGAQYGALLQACASDLVDLQDTFQVDYGYWVARQLGAAGR